MKERWEIFVERTERRRDISFSKDRNARDLQRDREWSKKNERDFLESIGDTVTVEQAR